MAVASLSLDPDGLRGHAMKGLSPGTSGGLASRVEGDWVTQVTVRVDGEKDGTHIRLKTGRLDMKIGQGRGLGIKPGHEDGFILLF